MNSGSNTDTSSECCGMCSKKIWMRDAINFVLCTASLDLVAVDAKACEHYEETTENTEQSFSKGF